MTDHEAQRADVLALEDLAGPDREAALAHLEACPECRSLREALLAREALARPAGSLPPPARWDALVLDDMSQAGERRSLAALLQRQGSRGSERPARRPAWTWWVPAAAAAAIAVFVAVRPQAPQPGAPPSVVADTPAPQPPAAISGLTLAPGADMRGGSSETWRTGDAFTLSFTLESAAPVIVVHVDPRGVAALLVPDSASDAAPLLGPGAVTLPPAGVRWTFEGSPGDESFLVASFVTAPTVAPIAAALPTAAVAGEAREARVRAVIAALQAAGARVERTDARHVR